MGRGGSAGAAGTGAPSFLQPIVSSLADKLGLSPQIAATVTTFAFTRLLPSLLGGKQAPKGGMPSIPESGLSQNLDQVIQSMGTTPQQQQEYIRKNGYARELAEEAGIDENKAATSLQTALGLFRDRAEQAAGASAGAGVR